MGRILVKTDVHNRDPSLMEPINDMPRGDTHSRDEKRCLLLNDHVHKLVERALSVVILNYQTIATMSK